jgi:hypothetical protein
MTDALVVADREQAGDARRFSWSLVLAGGMAATAVTFFLLLLGAGFGLLLVHPNQSAAPAFLAGGAVYFFVAQAFGFAVGGHLAGRLLALEPETRTQAEFRAAAHGFVVWAVAILAMVSVVALAGIASGVGGASVATLYGMVPSRSEPLADTSGYLVDKLYRPASAGAESTGDADVKARAEAARILALGPLRGSAMASDDRDRLTALVSRRTGLAPDAATSRVDHLQGQVLGKERELVDTARIVASYTSLWLALSLLFGAVVASVAAVFAHAEDVREAADPVTTRVMPIPRYSRQ